MYTLQYESLLCCARWARHVREADTKHVDVSFYNYGGTTVGAAAAVGFGR